MKPRPMRAHCYHEDTDCVRVRYDIQDALCVVSLLKSYNEEEEDFSVFLSPDKARRIAQRLIEIADYCDGAAGVNENEEEII